MEGIDFYGSNHIHQRLHTTIQHPHYDLGGSDLSGLLYTCTTTLEGLKNNWRNENGN